jgi:allantoin racemase
MEGISRRPRPNSQLEEEGMKIQLLLPFLIDAQNLEFLKGIVPPDVDIVGLTKGRVTETWVDAALTLEEELEAIVKAEKDGYDAVVMGCALDPGVREAREIVKIPVLGCFHTTLHLAGILGNRLSVIVPSGRYGIRMQGQNARYYGFDNVSFRSITFYAQQSLEQAYQYKKTGEMNEAIEVLTNESIRAIEDDDADVLALGCNALAWAVEPAKAELSKKGYDIPFIIPITASIEVAKSLVSLRLTHSNLFYPKFE